MEAFVPGRVVERLLDARAQGEEAAAVGLTLVYSFLCGLFCTGSRTVSRHG